jgi:hypothetical protein
MTHTIVEPGRGRHLILPDPKIVKEMSDGKEGDAVYLPTAEVIVPLSGTIITSGPDDIVNGYLVPNMFEPGDRVLFGTYGYDTLSIDGVTFYMVKDCDMKGRYRDLPGDDSEVEEVVSDVVVSAPITELPKVNV